MTKKDYDEIKIGPGGRTLPLLETERLLLRHLEMGDAEALFPLYSDSSVMELYQKEKCDTVEACRQFIGMMLEAEETSPGFRWSILLCDDKNVIGSLGYHAWDTEKGTAKMSYELVPSYRGYGYATEAAHTILRYGFERIELKTVLAEIHRHNESSFRVAQRLAFVESASDPALVTLVLKRRTFLHRLDSL